MILSQSRSSISFFCSNPQRRSRTRRRDGGGENGGGAGDWNGMSSPWPPKTSSSSGDWKEKSISSPSNPFVKHCVKLRLSSTYRHSHRSALVVGLIPILEIIRWQESNDNEDPIMDCLLLLDGAEAPKVFYNCSTCVVRVNTIVMKKLSGLQSIDFTEAVALMRMPAKFCNLEGKQEEATFQSWFPSLHRILVLDGIQDPGNLGALLRSAMAFKWDGVFLLPGCCDPFNEKAVRAARGASFQLPIVSGDWVHLETLRNKFQVKMLAGHPGENNNSRGRKLKRSHSLSQELADSLSDEPLCLVLGSEGQGLSEKTTCSCELISIPMAGKFESLNVSVAGGIFLFMLQQPDRQTDIIANSSQFI